MQLNPWKIHRKPESNFYFASERYYSFTLIKKNGLHNFREDKSSACESLTYHLNYSGGELKNFFVNMLISPFGNVQLIIEEVMKRKEIMDEIKNFITEREKLFNSQTGLLSRSN